MTADQGRRVNAAGVWCICHPRVLPLAPRCDSCGHRGCGGGTDCALRTGLRIMRLARGVRRPS